MKSDRPMMIWLAGVPCRESAVRTNESTMTMRVKQVISRRIEGASVSSVMMTSTLTALSTSTGLVQSVHADVQIEAAGIGVGLGVEGGRAKNHQEQKRRQNAASQTQARWAAKRCRGLRVVGLVAHYLRVNTCWKASAKLMRVVGWTEAIFSPSASGRWLNNVMPAGEDASRRRCCSIADHIDGLPLAERFGFEHIQFGRALFLDGQALPVAEEPHAAKKNADHQRQRAKNPENRSARVRQRAGNDRSGGG